MMYHEPVLLQESVEGLNINPKGIYIDATFGGGGHSREILKKLTTGKLFAFDQDEEATKNAIDDNRFILINQNFRDLTTFMKLQNAIPVDGLLADLGVSSHQFDSSERGFSIRFDSELDMRMSKDTRLTAKKIIKTYSAKELKAIFSQYGEVKNATTLSGLIVKARKDKKINTVNEFKEAIYSCVPKGKQNKYYAQVFQALRIEVNDELHALKDLLSQCEELIKSEGRLAVISYHSLEDRLVKKFIKTGKFEGEVKKDFYGKPIVSFRAVDRKPIRPSNKEIARNNRARSAKLRIAEKL
ncbi:MAG: 16S rRNA (cytosine(1402)-N(4))-methyltransferase RsmH [Bacteroidia bacterium]|nr:16S rRNA (cytosine(1402)-N(4))-methyltransferase RsmH [Bacteroidia bacterium]